MFVDRIDGLFVATCSFEQRLYFKERFWTFNAQLKRWTTDDIKRALEAYPFSRGDARVFLDNYQKIQAERVKDSYAADVDQNFPCPEKDERGRLLAFLGFQKAGIAFCIPRQNVLIADPPGLGKTIQAIGVSNACPWIRTVLIIPPASLKANWKKEWERWDVKRLRVGIVSTVTYRKRSNPGEQPAKYSVTVEDVWPEGCDVIIVNDEQAARHEERIKGTTWDLLIADEAHRYVNPIASRTRFIMGTTNFVAEKISKKWRKERPAKPILAKKRLFLTGTPILKQPSNLWTFCRMCDRDGLGVDFNKFVYRYCGAVSATFGLDISGATNLEELNEKLRASFMIRRNKREVLPELPDKRREIVMLPREGLDKAIMAEQDAIKNAMAAYEQMLAGKAVDAPEVDWQILYDEFEKKYAGLSYNETAAELQGEPIGFEEISTARKNLAIAKLPMVKTYIDSLLDAEEKLVIFCYHKEVAAALRASYPNCAFITGATPTHKRQGEVDRFQDVESCNPFIGNMDAAGVGFTLTAAHICVFIEIAWNPSIMEQCEDRIWRIGQKNFCLIVHLVVQGSIDGNMIHSLIEKQEVIEKVLDKPTP